MTHNANMILVLTRFFAFFDFTKKYFSSIFFTFHMVLVACAYFLPAKVVVLMCMV